MRRGSLRLHQGLEALAPRALTSLSNLLRYLLMNGAKLHAQLRHTGAFGSKPAKQRNRSHVKTIKPCKKKVGLRRNGQPEQLGKMRLILGRQLLHQGRICLDGRLELLVRHGRLWLCWLRGGSGCGCGRSGLSVAAVRGGLRARVQEKVRGWKRRAT